MILYKVSLVLFMLSSAAVAAEWESIGPDGGSFYAISTDPADAKIAVAVTTYPSQPSVFRTTDAGLNWTRIGQINDPYNYFYGFGTADNTHLYVAGMMGVHHSHDGGETWTYVQIPYSEGYIMTLCADPSDPMKVYVAGYKYVSNYVPVLWTSADGGVTFTVSNIGIDGVLPQGIDVSASSPGVIYLCGYKYVGGYAYPAVLRRPSSMSRWYDISSQVETNPGQYFSSIAIDPSDVNRVYTGDDSFYRTDDGGATWIKDASQTYQIRTIGVDPNDSKRVYVVNADTFFASENYGQDLVPYSDCFAGYPSVLEIAPHDSAHLYLACTSGGLFHSEDWGMHWDEAHHGISTFTIASMAVAPSEPETIYVNVQGSSTLMGSYDSGDTFDRLTYPQGCSGTINHLWARSTEPNELVALEAG